MTDTTNTNALDEMAAEEARREAREENAGLEDFRSKAHAINEARLPELVDNVISAFALVDPRTRDRESTPETALAFVVDWFSRSHPEFDAELVAEAAMDAIDAPCDHGLFPDACASQACREVRGY